MMKDFIEDAERWDLEPKINMLVVDKQNRVHTLPFEKSFKILGCNLQSNTEDARQFGREKSKCKHGLVERCEDPHMQRHALESETVG